MDDSSYFRFDDDNKTKYIYIYIYIYGTLDLLVINHISLIQYDMFGDQLLILLFLDIFAKSQYSY